MGRPGQDLIETPRLILERISSKHDRGILEAVAASRAELLPWMPWASETTTEGLRDTADEQGNSFAVIERAGGDVLGVVGLNPNEDGSFELHYWMRTDRTGRGLTTEAAREVLRWGRRELGVARFTLWAGRDNAASRRVAEKLGFRHVGPLDWRPHGGLGQFDAESYELDAG
jgi:RimJ/RimL family protein N-acetyltransferase